MRKKIYYICLVIFIHMISTSISGDTNLPTVMMTGYWDPSGRMIADFCTDTSLNPSGWTGGNWEDFGYDVYSFFPEPVTYTGMFEVDYQDTWEDFWKITDSLHPEAIISYGVGPVASGFQWELEYNARNLENEWSPDSKPPVMPTPSPPDSTKPAGYTRHPTLPLQEIVDALNAESSIKAVVDYNGHANFFLCEYMAYLGMWYQSLHSSPDDPYPCKSSGYIHIVLGDSLTALKKAVSVTLREVIKNLINTSADKTVKSLTRELSLQIVQNPYKASISIGFYLPQKQEVTMDLYNCEGKLVHSLIRGFREKGKNKIDFSTHRISSGIFVCRLATAGCGNISRKVIVCK